jgi:hypothetical protein
MSTSGITTFELSRDELVAAAIRKLAVNGDGVSPSTTQITNAAQALNAMLKTFQSYGMPLWAIKEYDVPMTLGTVKYNIGTGQTINTPMPLKVLQASLIKADGTDLPLIIETHYNYNLLPPASASSGEPTQIMYEPLAKYGVLNVWPAPDNSTSVIRLTYQRPFEDFTTSTDTPDFPSYWTEALIYGLAVRLAPEYGVPIQDRGLLVKEAEMYKQIALDFGVEEGGFTISPDWSRR